VKEYHVSEIFYSLQGEGLRAGAASVFVRFAYCNLDCNVREHGFDCDTDFTTGERMGLSVLLDRIDAVSGSCGWVVITGGEPSMQMDQQLLDGLHAAGYLVAVETNGTRSLPRGVDHVCLSPKPGTQLVTKEATEVKVVLCRGQNPPEAARIVVAKAHLVSPAWTGGTKGDPKSPGRPDEGALQWCIDFCLRNPAWRLSVQQHKQWKLR
jgi:organic radical activating enzyme